MNASGAGYRIGVDVGGTFTDVVCVRDGRPPLVFKVPSTPADPGEAALAAVARLAAEGVEPGALTQLAHGTTVATNAVLERKGGRLGIITTEGFRDTLEIGRQMRREMYEVRLDPQTPVFLASRAMRIGVRERVGPGGEVIEPLDEGSVRAALDRLVAAGAECVAVCLLFSFVNPKHERRVREIARSEHPELEVSLSSEVDPAFREYERTAVTAFDAYIKPTVRRYLTQLARRLADAGVPAPLQVMQSRGGLASAEIARSRPVRLFLSGPAAGVIGGQTTGAAAGREDLITLDVGGTSSDIALVSGAKPLIRSEGVIAGFPVRVPMVDVNAIGAGGGSVAWLDDAGGLRVGPRSAGSDPGPACYARGGREPTVTDASVVLGYLDPRYFAGGAIGLDVERARDAIRDCIAEPLGLAIEDAAAGIHQVVNAQMAEGVRLVSVRQGYDPREFTLVAMGGAGPLHACALAADLAITRVVVPRHPGVLSAAGLLAAPIEHEVSIAYAEPLAGLAMAPVRRIVADLDAAGRTLIEREGLSPDRDVEVLHFADICHVGQGYHLEVPFDPRRRRRPRTPLRGLPRGPRAGARACGRGAGPVRQPPRRASAADARRPGNAGGGSGPASTAGGRRTGERASSGRGDRGKRGRGGPGRFGRRRHPPRGPIPGRARPDRDPYRRAGRARGRRPARRAGDRRAGRHDHPHPPGLDGAHGSGRDHDPCPGPAGGSAPEPAASRAEDGPLTHAAWAASIPQALTNFG